MGKGGKFYEKQPKSYLHHYNSQLFILVLYFNIRLYIYKRD